MKTSSQKIIRIAITGPESTGKSTLAKQLAQHYQTTWVPEYARDYIDKLDRPYEEHDLVKIAEGQVEAEKQAEQRANRFLFCDTELIVLKIWSEHKYGRVDPLIISSLKDTRYDLYLLMDIDLAWAFDPQRENPDNRAYFFELFERELETVQANRHIIRGGFQQRFKNACRIIDALFR